MLVNFRVENFKSFKDLTEFSMEATKLKNLRDSNTFDVNNVSLLKSAVVYGANASGKSSLLYAMNSMKHIIETSLNKKDAEEFIPQPFLLNSSTEKKETFFEIEFIVEEILYRYGFNIATDATILNEWLYQKKLLSKARESRLFNRENQNFTLGTLFKEGKLLTDKTRENALFLSVVAQFNGFVSEKVTNWFKEFNIISNTRSDEFKHYSFDKLEDNTFREKIVTFIKNADVGISDISKKKISYEELKTENPNLDDLPTFLIDEMKKNGFSTIETSHIQYKDENSFNKFIAFPLERESDGTQKLLALSALIIETLTKGEVLVIDELDNSLHTELVEAIIKLFNSKETNPNNAQLIFSTHDTNLLNQELFRRDQIWFTEKNIYGESELYSLVEYGKGKTRDDLALEKNYLDGKFGAIPHIGSLNYEVD